MTDLEESVDDEVEEIDLAVVAYLDDEDWELVDLPDESLGHIDDVALELRQYPADSALALISVGEDFALLVRSDESSTRLLISDASAASAWVLARTATDLLGVRVGDDDDSTPAGDLALLQDLGLDGDVMAELVADEPHPDDLLSDVAGELGFGDELDEMLGDDEPGSSGDDDDTDETGLDPDEEEVDALDDDLEPLDADDTSDTSSSGDTSNSGERR